MDTDTYTTRGSHPVPQSNNRVPSGTIICSGSSGLDVTRQKTVIWHNYKMLVVFLVSIFSFVAQSSEADFFFDENILDFYVEFGEDNACQNYAIHYNGHYHDNVFFKLRKRSRPLPTSYVNYSRSKYLTQSAAPSLHVVFGDSHGHLDEIFTDQNEVDTNDYWLIQVNSILDDVAIRQVLKNVSLKYNSLTFVWGYLDIPDLDEETIVIREVYKIHESFEDIEILDYGMWTKDSGIILESEMPIWERRSNLKGHRFRISSNYNPPYITAVSEGCTNATCYTGMFAEVWHALEATMNYTYIQHPPPDKAWGSKLADGTFDGMIGMLTRDEIDIAPAEFTVTAIRSEVVDFNLPITESHQKLFVPNPAESFNWTAFLEPLSWSCWGVIVILIFTIPFVQSSAIKLDREEPRKDEFTLSKSFCFVAGALTIARGWSVTPKSVKGRILFFSVMGGGTLIFYHWEAMIISFLAVRTTVLPFNSMEQMARESSFKVAVQPGTSYVDTFRYSNNPMLKGIWEDRIEPYIADYPKSKIGLIMTIIEGDEFAFFDNFYTTITYEPYKKCQIIAIPIAYFPVQFAYAFPKKSPYFDAFWYQLNKMKERGATKQILEKYAAEKQVCPDYSGQPLGFGQSFTAFLCLMGGMFFGLVFLGVELIIPKHMWENSKIAEDWNGGGNDDLGTKPYPFPSAFALPISGRKMTTYEYIQHHQNQIRQHEQALANIKEKMIF